MSLLRQVATYERKTQHALVQRIVERIIRDLQVKDEVRYGDYLRGNTPKFRKPVENAFKWLINKKIVMTLRRGIYGRGPNWESHNE